ncbi:MAG: SCO family protein [Rhizobiaceae bacterium]
MRRAVAAMLAALFWAGPAGAAVFDFNGAELTTDTGEAVRFSPGLFAAPVTIVSFTFTGCTSVCPTASLVMNEVKQLAGKADMEIGLVTFTLDPLNDVPEVLAAHRRETGISTDPAWKWITGKPSDLIGVVERLGVKWGALDQHPSFFLLVSKDGAQSQTLWELETTGPALIDAAKAMAAR